MNDKKFIVYLKNGKFFTFNCANYVYKIDTERKLVFVTSYGATILQRQDVLVANLNEFVCVELVNF